jgi:Alpha/beta hydrolase domain
VSGKAYPMLVPAVDSDGNDIAGLRAPMVEAPLGTYTGWNLRSRGFGHGAMHEFSGSYIPFPESAEERRMTDDPRKSIPERYLNAAAYVEAITEAARRLVEEGLMLKEDIERATAAAADWGGTRHDVKLN